jgi:SAM-dependent methyltransferase
MDRLLDLTSRAETSHFWFRGFRQFVAPLIDHASAGRTDLRILDCGCGTGYNLRLLAPYGRACGMDLTQSGLDRARAAGRPLVRASAVDSPFATASFDLVTCFDVLQCVSDDRSVVREIARVLQPGGALVATVSAFEFLKGDHSLFTEEWRRYTRETLCDLLAGAGLTPERVSYTFASLFPLVFGVRLLQRLLRGEHTPSEQELHVPPAPVNAMLTALVSGEAVLARHLRMPFGSSLTVLARKPTVSGPLT